ncbi:MAG: hypothetical protein EBX39_10150, partial [Actinobacteria bacterium]|nr:hypothetical protein [Actinomycetota bacterium]
MTTPPLDPDQDSDDFLDEWRTLIAEQNQRGASRSETPRRGARPGRLHALRSHLHLRHRPLWQKVTAGIIAALILMPTLSLAHALLAPSTLTISERGAEWMRDNGLGGVLNQIEAWWAGLNAPKKGGEPDRAIEATTQET